MEPEVKESGEEPPRARLARVLKQVADVDTDAPLSWRKYSGEALDVDYCRFLSKRAADAALAALEECVHYFTGELAQVRVYGKWHNIPRQQCAFGEAGLQYTFSGRTVPAMPWPEPMLALKSAVERASGTDFNFVLVNRYRSGSDHMGEHRDDEKELDPAAPIASLSLGQPRDFVFKHRDARKPKPHKRDIPPVKLTLEHGSLLLMNPPTNNVWYHSLPPRKSRPGVRVNLTFRRMLTPAKLQAGKDQQPHHRTDRSQSNNTNSKRPRPASHHSTQGHSQSKSPKKK